MQWLATCVVCFLLSLIVGTIGPARAQSLEIEQATREISLTTQVTSVKTRFFLKNTGKQPSQFVDLCHLTEHTLKAAVFEVIQGDGNEGQTLPLEPTVEGREDGIACFKARLQQPLQPGKTLKLDTTASFTQLQTPYPASIFQNEPQRVLYKDNVYILSPYKVQKQSTKVKLPSKNVESYTKTTPVSLSQSTLKYGDYGPKEPFAREELRLHFENNTPFAVATSLVREVEISHWGNVYMEEHYTIKHVGAKIRGEWSRLDLMRDPKFGQTAVRGFLAHLPARAHSIYFKDAIGNISTSQIRPGVQATEVILTPRYPLYGGWQAEFIVGYSLPLQDVVHRNRKTGGLTAIALFGSSLAGVIADHIENRVVLPEGSTLRGVNSPFQVDQRGDTKYTYLDTSGRPVVVVSKGNIVFEHNVGFTVDYSFSSISLLREPLLLIGVYLVFFALVILYCRCNFVLTRGAQWEAEDKAERIAFLVEEITDIINERESQVLGATGGGGVDAAGLLEKLRRSEAKLNARCRDLEGLAGPKHSAIVRDLLSKEKAVQLRISQLASKGQSLQPGSDSKGATHQELEDVTANLKQDHAKKLGQLN